MDTLPTGIALLDDVLSEAPKRGELAVFVSGLPVGTEKTTLWRQVMERHGAVTFDFEAGLDPELTQQLLGRERPPDGDNTT